jgi:hypothetical protein
VVEEVEVAEAAVAVVMTLNVVVKTRPPMVRKNL